jgi:hypothetical protein
MDKLIKFLQRYRWAIGIAFALALLIICLFGFFPYRVFMGDDLLGIVSSQTGGWASSFAKAFTYAESNRYRPVFAPIFHLESILFGSNFNSYLYLNMLIEFLNACLVSYIYATGYRADSHMWRLLVGSCSSYPASLITMCFKHLGGLLKEWRFCSFSCLYT